MKALHCALVISTLFFFSDTRAQSEYEAGFRLSGLVYQGDLSPSPIGTYSNPTFGAGVFVTRIVNKKISVRANLDFGSLTDNDSRYLNPEWKTERNFNFRTRFTEASLHFVYHLHDNYDHRGFNTYIFGGAGLSLLNIQRDASAFNYNYHGWQSWVIPSLAEDLQVALPKTAVILPFGLGFRHPISGNLHLFGEGSYRLMFTDYLDGFSKSADRKWKDHYTNISLGLVYRFGDNGVNCPRY